jgi:hypothetical protein
MSLYGLFYEEILHIAPNYMQNNPIKISTGKLRIPVPE